jgi:hypothetical protein
MSNHDEIRAIRESLAGTIRSQEKVNSSFGKEMSLRLALSEGAAAAIAFHKAQVTGEQYVNALLELDMALHDLLNG